MAQAQKHDAQEAQTFECELQGYTIRGRAYPIKHSQFHDYGVEVTIDGEDFTFKMIMTRIQPKLYNANMVVHTKSQHKRFFRFQNPLTAEECFEQTLIICIEELNLIRQVSTTSAPSVHG